MGRSPFDKNSLEAEARIYRLASVSIDPDRVQLTYLFDRGCVDEHELDGFKRMISAHPEMMNQESIREDDSPTMP